MNTASVWDHRERRAADTASVLEKLRQAGLRPTTARVTVLQVMEAESPAGVSVDGMYRQLLLRGTQTSIGTVYQTMQALCARSLLVKDPSAGQAALYRLRQVGRDETKELRLICSDSGEVVLLRDDDLHARLLEAARRAGVDLSGQPLHIKYDRMRRLGRDEPSRLFQRGPRLVE